MFFPIPLVINQVNKRMSMENEKLIETLDKAYSEGTPLVSDDTYDEIREELEKSNPSIKNKVGAEPRVPVRLPVITPSLNKLRETEPKGLSLWVSKQGVQEVYVSDKLDGISALYTTTNGFVLLSRGNGVFGEDISHLLQYLNLPRVEGIVVRGELILPKSVDKGRNIVAGMANSKKSLDEEMVGQVKFLAHRLYGCQSVDSMYEQLSTLGFDVVHHEFLNADSLSMSKLNEMLASRREQSAYPLDGLVVCKGVIPQYVESECVREDGTPINPKWAFAFKSSSQQIEYITKVIKVEWNPSKSGLLIPVVHFEPVCMGEVTVSKASGQNGRFVFDNNIGAGATVVVVRSGDVIPYISKVIEGSVNGPDSPEGIELRWNESNKNLLAPEDCLGVKVQELVYFCKVMGVKGLDQGVIEKLGVNNVIELLSLSLEDIKEKEGFSDKSAQNILNALKVIKDQSMSKWMKASNCFNGVSSKALFGLHKDYPRFWIEGKTPTTKELLGLEGVGKKSAGTLLECIEKFKSYVQEHRLFMSDCQDDNG